MDNGLAFMDRRKRFSLGLGGLEPDMMAGPASAPKPVSGGFPLPPATQGALERSGITAQPQTPEMPQRPAPEGGGWKDALGKIGGVLYAAGQGLRGGGDPLAVMRQVTQGQRDNEAKRFDFLMDTVATAANVMRRVPEGQREQAMGQLQSMVEKFAPGFDLKTFIGKADERGFADELMQARHYGQTAKRIIAARVNAQGEDSLFDHDFLKTVQEIDDDENRDSIAAKGALIRKALGRRGLSMTEFEAMNKDLGDVALTSGELRTLRRTEALQRYVGITPDKEIEAAARSGAAAAAQAAHRAPPREVEIQNEIDRRRKAGDERGAQSLEDMANYGRRPANAAPDAAEEIDLPPDAGESPPPDGRSEQPVQVSTPEEAAQLPPGTLIMTPQGLMRTKRRGPAAP